MGLSPLVLFLVTGFLAAVLAEPRAAPAAADDPAGDQSAVQAATYSTGKAGSRLKWIGRRPESAKETKETEKARDREGRIGGEADPVSEPDPSCEPSCGTRTAQDDGRPPGHGAGR